MWDSASTKWSFPYEQVQSIKKNQTLPSVGKDSATQALVQVLVGAEGNKSGKLVASVKEGNTKPTAQRDYCEIQT